jgi:6-phosphogluconolactonase/glucosamine-6-phosphate isomerase/deaminase
MAAPTIEVLENEQAVSSRLCNLIIDRANKAIAARNVFTIGVSGKYCKKLTNR